jgi:hypothetical protein
LIVLKVVVAVSLLILFVGLCIYSGFLTQQIAELVNIKKVDRYSLWWWTPNKRRKIFAEYRAFYPEGKLILRYHFIVTIIFILLAAAIWSLFHRGISIR